MERIKLDLVPSCIRPVLHASQYDIGRQWRIDLLNNGVPYVLQEGDVVEYEIRKGDGLVVTGSIAYIPGATYVILVSTEQMCAIYGSNLGELKISSNGAEIGTGNFILDVEKATTGGEKSKSVIWDLQAQVDDCTQKALENIGAKGLSFDNEDTDLEATNTEDAIKEVNSKVNEKADASSLAEVATSGSYNDLTDKPTIPEQVQSDWNEADNTKPDYIKNKPNLSTVATSGNYNDLSNKPTIPAAQVNSDWNANSGVSQILNKPNLATVATSGDYNDLNNKPSVAVIDDTQASASKVYSSNKVVDLLNGKANTNLDNVVDGVVTQPKLSFAEAILPSNIYDYQSEEMSKKGYWYYSNSLNTVISPTLASSYTAITIPIYNATHIYFKRIATPTAASTLVYWCGFTDENMVLLSKAMPSGAEFDMVVPNGAKYFIASYQSNSDTYLAQLVVSPYANITTYQAYEPPKFLLKGCMPEYNAIGEKSVSIRCADSYDLVVNDTFQLFYKGIIEATNDKNFFMLANSSKGNAYKRFYEITPTQTGDVVLNLSLYDEMMNLIDTKSITLKVHSKAISPLNTKNILCVGDSLTISGEWVAELKRRLTASGGSPAGDNLSNINFIGTCEANGVQFEGYGGWSFLEYNNESVTPRIKNITCSHDKTEAQDQHSIYQDSAGGQWKLETISNDNIKIILVSGNASNFPSTGTLTWVSGGVNHSNIVYTASENASGNPFWDTLENKVDFASYASRLGVNSIDFVYVLLGWNNAAISEETYKQRTQTFIDNVQASFPNAKIVLIGIEHPAQDGLGLNYGATGTYSNYYNLIKYVHNLDDWYEDLVAENSNVYHINISGQFDTEYNMPTSTRTVNIRNATTETYQSNGIHPATSGYLQIADAVYRQITTLL